MFSETSVSSRFPVKYLDINLLVAEPKFFIFISSFGLFLFINFSIILSFVSFGICFLYSGWRDSTKSSKSKLRDKKVLKPKEEQEDENEIVFSDFAIIEEK